MVIRDPSRGPKYRSHRCDLALGHRSHNRSNPDHIENPDSPPIVAASLNDTCRTCQRRPAQSDPPQTPHFAARRCDRTAGPITRLWGSLWAHVSLREGGENAVGIMRSIIPVMDQSTVPRFARPIAPRSRPPSRTARRLAAASISPNTRESYRRALRQVDAWRGRRPLGRRDPGRLLGRPLRRWPHPEQRGRRRRRRPLPRPHGRPLFGRSHRRTRRGRLLPVAP